MCCPSLKAASPSTSSGIVTFSSSPTASQVCIPLVNPYVKVTRDKHYLLGQIVPLLVTFSKSSEFFFTLHSRRELICLVVKRIKELMEVSQAVD